MAAILHMKMFLWLFLAFCHVLLCSGTQSDTEPWIRGSRLLRHWISSLFTRSSDWKAAVPPQLLVVSKLDSFLQLPRRVQANLADILSNSPGVKLRWMGNSACRSYLQVHYDRELLSLFLKEEHGPYRSDICRTAVLLREGGFSTDLDVELIAPLGDLVDSRTTFMAVYSEHSHTALSALLAAAPGNPVLEATLLEMRKWYRHPDHRRNSPNNKIADQHMGPLTLFRGIRRMVQEHCPGTAVGANMAAEWACGQEVFQFHRERRLDCQSDEGWCGAGRAASPLKDHRIGLFQSSERQFALIGWPRGAWCVDSNCGEPPLLPLDSQPLHVGSVAFWPLLIGFACVTVVLPNMIFGFLDMFLGACDIVKGPRFYKGCTNSL